MTAGYGKLTTATGTPALNGAKWPSLCRHARESCVHDEDREVFSPRSRRSRSHRLAFLAPCSRRRRTGATPLGPRKRGTLGFLVRSITSFDSSSRI